MSKKNPYEEDQELLDLNKVDLESLDEAKLKELKTRTSELYTKARKDRIDTQRQFIRAYQNSKDKLKALYEGVKDTTVSPEDAVKQFQEFVADSDLLKAERV